MIHSDPSVTVVIPCHNYARFLPEALSSVFAQSCPPAEVIVVDDGSTDESAEVAAGFDARVQVILQAQQGISGARNTGIRAARGELIAFIDADDLWPVDSLAVRLEAMASQPEVDCVFGQLSHFICPRASDEVRSRLFCPPGVASARMAGTMLARRALFDTIGLFDTGLRTGEMIDWTSRLLAAGSIVASIEECVLERRIHGANTVLNTPDSRSDYLRALRAKLDRNRTA